MNIKIWRQNKDIVSAIYQIGDKWYDISCHLNGGMLTYNYIVTTDIIKFITKVICKNASEKELLSKFDKSDLIRTFVEQFIDLVNSGKYELIGEDE